MTDRGFEYIGGKKLYYSDISDVKKGIRFFGFFLVTSILTAISVASLSVDMGVDPIGPTLIVVTMFFGLVWVFGMGVRIETQDGQKFFLWRPFEINIKNTIDHYKTLADFHST